MTGLTQLWPFIVAPPIGAGLGGVVRRYLFAGAAPVEPAQFALAAEPASSVASRSARPAVGPRGAAPRV